MSDDRDDEGPVHAIAAVVSTIAAGMYAFLKGLITLDLTFLLSGKWFGISSLIANAIGPEFLPGVPWNVVFLVAALGMLAVSFYKISNKTKTTQ